MATETTQQATSETDQHSVSGEALPTQAEQTFSAEKSTTSEAPLPPRIDSGTQADDVLGEVNKLFGQESGRSVPISSMVGDDFDEHLSAIKGADTADSHSPAPSEPSKEMQLGTAADLFRSEPDSGPTGTPEPHSRHDTGAGQITSDARGGRVAGATSLKERLLAHPATRFPARAKVPIALALAVIIGWVAGAYLTGSHAGQNSETAAEAENSEESIAHPTEESAAKFAELEEELRRASAERDAAQHAHEKAIQRLKQAETKLIAGEHATQDKIKLERESRQKAEEDFRKADELVRRLQHETYNVQLARARDTWRRNPGLARALLEDVDRCPPQMRDFVWGYLLSRTKNDRETFSGHVGPVATVDWSPDGKLIASGGQDGMIKLRDSATGQETASLWAHAGGVWKVTFSQRGELLASGGADGTVKLWEVASRKLLGTYFGHMAAVRAVALSPDVSRLVSASDDGTVKFWDVVLRRPTATRWGHPRSGEPDENPQSAKWSVRSLAYSPDGRFVASGGDRVIRIWNADTAIEKAALSVAEGPVTALAFSPLGTTLTAGTLGAIYHFRVDSLVSRLEPSPVEGTCSDLRYSADGRLLAAATDTGVLVLHEPADIVPPVRNPLEPSTEVERFRFQSVEPIFLRGHAAEVTGVAFSPDAGSIVTSSVDGTVRLWDAQKRAEEKVGPDLVWRDCPRMHTVAYSPAGDCFAAAGKGTIHLWTLPDNVETITLDNHSSQVNSIAFSPNGKLLASAGRDWPVLIWDLAARRVKTALNGHTAEVYSVAFSPDGSKLLSAGEDGTIRVWDASGGRQTGLLTGHAAAVLAVAMSPDGKWAASASADHSVRLWDLEHNLALATFAGHTSPVVSLAFSPDGHYLVSAESRDAEAAEAIPAIKSKKSNPPIALWRLPKGDLVQRFGQVNTSVSCVRFSSDGKTLATSDREGITLWDALTCEARETLTFSLAGPIGPLAFSPASTALSAGGKAALVFWTASPFASKPVRE